MLRKAKTIYTIDYYSMLKLLLLWKYGLTFNQNVLRLVLVLRTCSSNWSRGTHTHRLLSVCACVHACVWVHGCRGQTLHAVDNLFLCCPTYVWHWDSHWPQNPIASWPVRARVLQASASPLVPKLQTQATVWMLASRCRPALVRYTFFFFFASWSVNSLRLFCPSPSPLSLSAPHHSPSLCKGT